MRLGEPPGYPSANGGVRHAPPAAPRSSPPVTRVAARSRDGDAALLERLASREPGDALERLYDRFAPSVYGLGLRALRDAQLAEDVVQDTFVRIWRSAARFDARRGSAATWIFALARRAAIDPHRRRPEAPKELPEDLAADDQFEALVTALGVRDALAALTPAHREVLELTYDADLTQTSIAERLGVPLGTIKSRTYHALRALRDVLVERGIDG